MFGKLIAFQIITTARREKTPSPKSKMKLELTLTKREQFAENIYGFWFKAQKEISFKPGQFLEWTLEHKNPDNRGSKRFFTVSSSPTEKEILLTTKIIENPSSFKKSLKELKSGDKIMAEGPYGEFVLPENKDKKLVFIAGGIGVTPFRSILKYLLSAGEKRDITLFYAANSAEEIVFSGLFKEAEENLGLKTVYAVKTAPEGWQGETGHIDGSMIKKHIKNTDNFIFYVSGPEPMVHATSEKLIKAGIKEKQIKHDYFPGYDEI